MTGGAGLKLIEADGDDIELLPEHERERVGHRRL